MLPRWAYRLAIGIAVFGSALAEFSSPGTVMAQECSLSVPLRLEDTQSGFAGETGTVWTIAPDCSFTIARRLGRKILEPHKRGQLTPEQQTQLKSAIDQMSQTGFPKAPVGAPQVNARRLNLSYGGKEMALTLAPGGGDFRELRASVTSPGAKVLLDTAAAIKKILGS